MKPNSSAKSYLFHGHKDFEAAAARHPVEKAPRYKHFIVRERQVSYRFYPHFHPYVTTLAQKLLRGGTRALQAADTTYAADNAALPGSIEVELAIGAALTVPAGARIALLADTQGSAGGVPTTLQADLELTLSSDAPATSPDGMKATLVAGMTGTPGEGAIFPVLADSRAVLIGDTRIALTGAATVTLHDGTAVTLPAVATGTTVLLPHRTRLTIPNGTQARLLKSKRRPQADVYADFFATRYQPSELVELPYPAKDLDFTFGGAYAVYNWELFFHVPLTIAIHLSRNQRFTEAQRWFHYLFDPTDDSDGPTPERFWKVRPFQYTDVKKIEEILINLSTNADPDLRDETILSIDAWKDAPFRPHVIARYRQQAYMYKTVMAYLDNLIAWGDSLFRQDTGEAIDEALMLYVLAANILGPRPLPVPKKGKVRPQTYDNLREDLRQFGTVMRDVEADGAFDLMPFPTDSTGDSAQLATVRALGKALYFCVPRNDKLLAYWDTVADRLFKIRNSLNLQGIFRQLALFEPPIDPAMLARAAAAGLDVGAIVNGLNQPLPLVRFQLLAQKAAEIVQEVKSLGNNLLSAMEKEDGEALGILRARHERVVLEMVERVKFGQVQEAIKSREGLLKTLALAVQRYTYYERQLGKQADEIEKAIPQLDELDTASLEKLKFAMQEPAVALREVDVDIATDLGSSGGKIISSHENQEIAKLHEARDLNDEAAGKDKIAAGLSLLPELGVDFHFWGMGGHVAFGGSALSRGMSFWASFAKTDAEKRTYESGSSARVGSYARRQQDWAFQSNQAAGEITQVFKQLRAAQIREAIAELELKNHRQQMKHAQEIERFLNAEGTEKKGKRTNQSLYAWMKREVKGLYAQCFQLAFDVAKKAERALQHELGNRELSFLQFGYLAGKEGLLAGEKLYLDVKRMELAYHDLNQREYELTKHVSLLQVDPLALVRLRTTGRCTVRLPEMLFDMDGPGHYFRRIKTVAVSVPCVTGPYASVNCTLSLLKSSVRTSPLVGDGYARTSAEDGRFSDSFSSLQSIVTSSAQNDSGMFETNLRDERYLPFEHSGVESEWRLQLPANPSKGDPQQFDYKTIADVVLHIRYTAREGGDLLRQKAVENWKQLIADSSAAGSMRLFAVRSEFPSEWAKVQSTSALTLDLRKEHFPLWMQSAVVAGMQLDALVIVSGAGAGLGVNGTALVKDPSLGDVQAASLRSVASAVPPLPMGTVFRLTLQFTDQVKAADDVWLLLRRSQGG